MTNSNEPSYKKKEKLTLREAGWLINKSPSTIYQWIAMGELAFIDGEKKKYVLKKDLLAHKDKQVGRPPKKVAKK